MRRRGSSSSVTRRRRAIKRGKSMSAKKSQQDSAAPIETAFSESKLPHGHRAYAELLQAQRHAWVDYNKELARLYADWATSVREADAEAWKPVEEAQYVYLRASAPFFDREGYRRCQEAAEHLVKAQAAFAQSETRREAYRTAAERFN